MNKNEAEVIKKIKEIMTSFQNTPGAREFLMGNRTGKSDFALVETDTHRHITLFSATSSKQNPKRLTDKETFEIVEDYFENGGKPLKITVHGKARYNSLLNILMKKQPTGEFLDMVLNAFFDVKDNDIFDDALTKINKSINDKSCDPAYGRDLAFKTLARIGQRGQILNNQAYYYGSRFPSICSEISKFKITTKEYAVLHNMFGYFESAIEKDSNCRNAFIGLLKKSIPSKDWSIFKAYLKDEKPAKPQSQIGDMFEEKNNPKYHLNINEEFVTNRYPSVSLSTDYVNMISLLVGIIRDYKEQLGLEQCHIISQSNKVTSIYFLSQDEKPVDAHKMKTVFSSLIEFYAEMKDKKENITKDALGLALKANLLAIELEKRAEKEELKNSRRPNKI